MRKVASPACARFGSGAAQRSLVDLHVRDDGNREPFWGEAREQRQCVWLAFPLSDEDVRVDKVGHRLTGSAAAVLSALGAQIAHQSLPINIGESIVQGPQPGDGRLGIVAGE